MKAKKLRIAFLLDPLEKLSWQDDTSCTIMAEAGRRGHAVYAIQMGGLIAENRAVFAQVARLNVSTKEGIRILETVDRLNLRKLDIVFIRKEPPFDSEYLYATQILDRIAEAVWILNSPEGLRRTNEKLSILEFPEHIPPTLVSARAEEINAFARKIGPRIIVKPLDQKGGQGVMLLDSSHGEFHETLLRITEHGKKTVMSQPFLPEVQETGDVRVLLLGGKILGTFCRVPLKGGFLANMDQGGRAVSHKLTPRERKISLRVGSQLLKHGHHFVGIDLISEKLTEINVTSPAGIFEMNQLEGGRLEEKVVDELERKIRLRNSSRKTAGWKQLRKN